MADINRNKLIPYLSAYKAYLDGQEHGKDEGLLSDKQEEYKKEIAAKAAEVLGWEDWNESEIGKGSIGEHAIKAVQRNVNLVGRFQVTAFSDKVKENPKAAESILFELYHNRNDQECFEQLCSFFGRKYDLLSYLYFILDPNRYLPLRPTIFDKIFKKLDVSLQTSGRCSWDNYQEYLGAVTAVREIMQEYYDTPDIDLLDAHSFLWTLNSDVLKIEDMNGTIEEKQTKEKTIDVGSIVLHKDYGEGTINNIRDGKIYVQFRNGIRIFPYTDAFEKGYLTLQ